MAYDSPDYSKPEEEEALHAAIKRHLSWSERVPGDIPEDHHRCMHCGEYFDECQCDGGWPR